MGGIGRKVYTKDLLADLPKDAKIVLIDPEEDYKRLKQIQFSPSKPVELICLAQFKDGAKNEK